MFVYNSTYPSHKSDRLIGNKLSTRKSVEKAATAKKDKKKKKLSKTNKKFLKSVGLKIK